MLGPPSSRSIDSRHVKYVDSFQELLDVRFSDGVNALCWRRNLPGDFDAVARKLRHHKTITPLETSTLLGLELDAAGTTARAQMIADQTLLRDAGLQPSLEIVPGYDPQLESQPVSTDVCSWHADSATGEADTYLCSYNQACSEGLPNEQARRKVDNPEIRARLLALYQGADDPLFEAWLNDQCFDLHYESASDARPYRFGFGNLWRIATLYPQSPVPPCIHRAPSRVASSIPRLLLIS
ncbi:hypothetical protein [Pelagicoccus sp. SDUM812003]|uniref:hypothetical protein n=1 Tax=Pelagicoccus sp. SDUM812003 TaxID=3041267 RepID=UPI00280FACE3|nr:hypothetical protein [Pelagicoccus sp. SDUM812003]MDQ8201391.1 hypothetical protein [Pelagicoccus sp. SDUM812003]